ncbi:MAG: bifunctional histidinol-phosphatase/imidazoleglycerol-phosphate dehydratase HisB [Proteobacteria bacterium]|nr:bifunctional histidinol-phosphatase/imidazoleglycerol-phosphate dehydratase HisB [Pseudomonadota bacterium]
MLQQKKFLFIDRDGTLIEEPEDKQVDSLNKIKLIPNVIPALRALQTAGFELVMVTNQDGLGSKQFPQENFALVQEFVLSLFSSQGIHFDNILICPHLPQENCDCRKPKVGLVLEYLKAQVIDKENSYVIGDRLTDLQLAQNIGITGLLLDSKTKTWNTILDDILFKPKIATITRVTKETQIEASVNLTVTDNGIINTGIGFFDHMLAQLSYHGGFGLVMNVNGDLQVDDHHTVEDSAIVIGQALRKALQDKSGISRYGFVLPMDESLATVALDICGRPYFSFKGHFAREKVGELSTELVSHFFYTFAQNLGATLHIEVKGENTHHMVEAVFKAVGRSLRQALKKSDQNIPSTKGIL